MDDLQQIERYLAGELDTAQQQALEKRLQEDTAFAELFALYKSVDTEMQQTEDEQVLRTKLTELNKKHFNTAQPAILIGINNRKHRWLYVAAAAAAILILYILIPVNKPLNNEQLFAQYAVPDELPSIIRGENDDSLLLRATTLFNQKDFAAALPLMDSILRLKPDEAQFQLSLGICLLQTGDYNRAITVFDSLAAKETVYKYKAIAWKAYTYLRQDKRNDCVAALKQIPADADVYEKTKMLLKTLGEK